MSRKKVLYFNHTSHIGGAGMCLYQLVQALPREIVEPVVVLPAEGDLGAIFSAAGIEVIIEPNIKPLMGNSNSSDFWRWSSWEFFLAHHKATEACWRICGEQMPDIVHLNTTVLFHLAEGAKKAGVEKVVLHNREHWVVKKWDPRERLKRRKVPQFVDEIIAISKTSAEMFGYEQKTTVVYDWPDFEGRDGAVDMEMEYGISSHSKVILFPGGRSVLKGSMVALRAMEFVRDKDAIALLLCVAEPEKKIIKRVVLKTLRVLRLKSASVRMDEAISRSGEKVCVGVVTKNIKSLMEQSCVIVSPFTIPHFSMPSIEAGLLKKPVIISDNGHARETVLDGESGLIVPSGSIQRLSEALNRLLLDASERERMGEAGYRHVTRCFCKKEGVKKVLNVYGLTDFKNNE